MSLLTDLGNINHRITLQEAIAMTTRYRKEMDLMLKPEYAGKGILPFAETFEKSIFKELYDLTGCVGIRSYLGLDDKNNVRLIFVGVNDKNEDILPAAGAAGSIFEYGQRCPPICGVGPLNPPV